MCKAQIYPDKQNVCWELSTGGGSSIVKVPGGVPPARVCFFKPSILIKGILFANFSPLCLAKGILLPIFANSVWARVYLLAILVKEMLNFGNSCRETQIFFQILVKIMEKFGKFCPENATHGTFDVEISLAKGIIFRKIGLANGAILKPWAAHPCPKFSREPPPPSNFPENHLL